MVVVGLILVVCGLSLPSMIEARQRGNETSAVASLGAIEGGEESLLRTREAAGTLEELARAEIVDSATGSGQRAGYRFAVVLGETPDDWAAVAWPTLWGVTG